jgi:hypothetical protein
MSKWERGAADIEEALKERTLQAITGGAAGGTSLLAKAERTIATARAVAASDPDSAFVLACDAAKPGRRSWPNRACAQPRPGDTMPSSGR